MPPCWGETRYLGCRFYLGLCFGKERGLLEYKADRLLLVKCCNNKMVKLPGESFYRTTIMQLTNKK